MTRYYGLRAVFSNSVVEKLKLYLKALIHVEEDNGRHRKIIPSGLKALHVSMMY